jgi:hypothetical protein
MQKLVLFSCIAATAALFAAPPLFAAAGIAIPNGGFEDRDTSDATKPTHWRLDGKAEEITIDIEKRYRGQQSLRVKFKEGAPYAGVIHRLNAEDVRGKTLFASAWIARGRDGASTGIWIRAFDSDKKSVAYVNTYDSLAAKETAWTQHNMNIEIPASAAVVMMGVSTYGKDGVMWVDEVAIAVQEPKSIR